MVGWEVGFSDLLADSLVDVHVQPQLDKPPRTTYIAYQLIGSQFCRYLMKQKINCSQQMLA
jgi:hypothetical protein